MLRAFHAKNVDKFKGYVNDDVVVVEGLPLPCVIIDGDFLFNVKKYLELFYFGKGDKAESLVNSRYYLWKRRVNPKEWYGRVVALSRDYYADIEYLGSLTKSLCLVEDAGSLFATTTAPEHEDGVIAIYRGNASAPTAVTDSNKGFSWDDFYEVEHSTLVTAGRKNSPYETNTPVIRKSTGEGIVKPAQAEDMPEVITLHHPVNKTDVRKATTYNDTRDRVKESTSSEAVAPVVEKTTDVSDLMGIGALVNQLTQGKKVKLTITLELE
jgi:hypothetical protein